jgi:hypothetical protein
MTDSKMKARARVEPALYSVMAPGDQIVAGMYARLGPPLGLDLLPPLVAWLVFTLTARWDIGLAGHGHLAAANAVSLAVAILTIAVSAPPIFRKQVFVAITQRQFICYRLTLFGRPRRLMFAAPLQSGPVSCHRWSMRYPGPGSKTIRFNAGPRWRVDLGQVASALQASGTFVESGRRPSAALRSGT